MSTTKRKIKANYREILYIYYEYFFIDKNLFTKYPHYMKKKYLLLLIPFLLGCTTTKESIFESTDIIKIIKQDNKKVSSQNLKLIKELRYFGLHLSDILLLTTGNSPETEINKDSAIKILNNKWKILSRKELLDRIDKYYNGKTTIEYISALNRILTKPDLLINLSELKNKNTWKNELLTGFMNSEDFRIIDYLINNSKYLTIRDTRVYDLSIMSYLTRIGRDSGFLNETEANRIIDKISIEMMDTHGDWYEIGKSFLAGISLKYWFTNDLNSKLSENAMAAANLIDNLTWSNVSLDDGRKIMVELEKTDTVVNIQYPFNIPELPEDLIIHKGIQILFNKNRDSYDLISIYNKDYQLYKAIRKDNFIDVKEIIDEQYHHHDYLNHNGNSMIMEGVGKNPRILSALLELGFNPNISSKYNKETPLYIATKNKQYDDMKILLSYNADPNQLNDKQETPLSLAVEKKDERSVDLLLASGANPDIGLIKSYSVMGFSLRNSYDSITYKLLEKSSDLNQFAKKDWRLIHIASRYSTLEILKSIVFIGTDINVQKEDGYTALMLAMSYNGKDKIERINFLIKMGADCNIIDNKKYNMILLYLDKEHYNILTPLTKEGKNVYVNVENFAPYFKTLLDITDNKDQKCSNNKSVLWYLRNYGTKDQINYYLSKTPEQKEISSRGFEILFALMIRGMKEEFKNIVLRVESLDYREKSGWNLLYLSLVNHKYHWASEILLKNGADYKNPGPDDRLIINMNTTIDNYKTVVKILKNTNTIKDDSFKYFTIASEYWCLEVIKALKFEVTQNSTTITNKSDGNLTAYARKPFPNKKDFSLSFMLNNYDKGTAIIFNDEDDSIVDNKVSISLTEDLKMIVLQSENGAEPQRISITKSFNKGDNYLIEVKKKNNMLSLYIDNDKIGEYLLYKPLPVKFSILFPGNSAVNFSSIDYKGLN